MGSVLLLCVVGNYRGLQMDLGAIFDKPCLFCLGIVWMIVHILVMLICGLHYPKHRFFYVAVGSQKSVGWSCLAPIVALLLTLIFGLL